MVIDTVNISPLSAKAEQAQDVQLFLTGEKDIDAVPEFVEAGFCVLNLISLALRFICSTRNCCQEGGFDTPITEARPEPLRIKVCRVISATSY